MENFLRMLNVQSVLFVYILVGILCQKLNLLDDHTRGKLTDLVVYVTMPCMVFESFNVQVTLETLKQASLALVIAAVMALIALVAGKFLYLKFPPQERCIMEYGTLVTNSGFAGLPIVSGMFGSEGLLLGSLFIIPTRILMWSAGLSLFTPTSGWEGIKKVAVHPTIIAVYLGLIRMFTGFPLPGFLDSAIGSIGDCTSPLAMMLVGVILAQVPLRDVVEGKIFYLVLVRQILFPAACLVVLKALAVDPLTIGVSVVLSGMPIGSTTAILAAKYGADARYGSKCVFISTVTSLLTVPLLTLFL